MPSLKPGPCGSIVNPPKPTSTYVFSLLSLFLSSQLFTRPTTTSIGSMFSRIGRAATSSNRRAFTFCQCPCPYTARILFPPRLLRSLHLRSNALVPVCSFLALLFSALMFFFTASVSEIPPIVLPGKKAAPVLPKKKGPSSRQERVCHLSYFP